MEIRWLDGEKEPFSSAGGTASPAVESRAFTHLVGEAHVSLILSHTLVPEPCLMQPLHPWPPGPAPTVPRTWQAVKAKSRMMLVGCDLLARSEHASTMTSAKDSAKGSPSAQAALGPVYQDTSIALA